MPRLTPQRLVRGTAYILAALMLCHIVLMLNNSKFSNTIPSYLASGSLGSNPVDSVPPDEETSIAGRRRMASIKAIPVELLQRFARPVPQHLPDQFVQSQLPDRPLLTQQLQQPLLLTRTPFNFTPVEDPLPLIYSLQNANATAILDAMLAINAEHEILNAQFYNGPITEVIVVQVHDRIGYLYLLIDSLRRVKDVEDCLLVFSHDVYSSAINALVRSIRFARVLQIFYPYTKQIYFDRFPGNDPRDCPRDAGLYRARQLGCNNAEWPDKYGHYRESKYTQTKHHWLYKMNRLFERSPVLANFTGQFVFLEEDHYVVEDLLHMLRLMVAARKDLSQNVEILTLGTYEKKPDFTRNTAQVVVDKWVSSFHNMGMSFSRAIWDQIKPCLPAFCSFDDYNWDWSLNHILTKCTKRPFQTMVIRISPRVFHIGQCGVHHKNKVCNPALLSSKLDRMLANNIAKLYPDQLMFNAKLKIRARALKPNGGWGDLRDRRLCSSFFNSSESPPSGLPYGM
ncbi:hypothetical protein BOX15_Mlig004091g1 [Macrostomum lignano]|uniref:Alpha-1,6-mannosyl-glycoprotein 2-beta-N-acetylglucosaminyltransferase n=1 Tax=Macrostomum lignano TaxID=282301 RepID=A0A267FKN7_9PLAT|nr:hypothetical protein BOX15_Mlig032383g1 [Macrostomum lignano]PAA81100.1 hypothetical protein BOX15_Mlig004091g1 [Macrostomum lignano]